METLIKKKKNNCLCFCWHACERLPLLNLDLCLTSYTLYWFHIRGETSHAESEETQAVSNPEEIDIDEDDDDDDDNDDEPGKREVFFHYLMFCGGEGRAALLD